MGGQKGHFIYFGRVGKAYFDHFEMIASGISSETGYKDTLQPPELYLRDQAFARILDLEDKLIKLTHDALFI